MVPEGDWAKESKYRLKQQNGKGLLVAVTEWEERARELNEYERWKDGKILRREY